MFMSRTIVGAFVSLAIGSAQAALIDRGGGLIYDTDLDVTWMANASLSASNNFGALGLINPTGTMNWSTAREWLDAMNSQNYLGFSNWRLPTTLYPDPTCANVSGGHGCIGSEMGHLFYEELGGVAGADIATTHNSNYSLFQDIQSNWYWSGTGFTQAPQTPNDHAWTFYFPGGVQSTLAVEDVTAVWAVRDGDVAVNVLPEPGTLPIAMVALGALGVVVRRGKLKMTQESCT